MKMVRFKRVVRPVAVAFGVAALAAACTTNSAPLYRIPDQAGINFRWSAEPGLGLTTDPAIVARAFMESAFISYGSLGIDSDRPEPTRYSYPGYKEAYPHFGSHEMVIGGVTMGIFSPGVTRTVGTFYAHLLELRTDESAQPQADPPEWRAVMCVWVDALDVVYKPSNAATVTKSPDGDRYSPILNIGSGPYGSGSGRTVRLTLQQPPAGHPTRLSSGEGPARYPTSNVFGEWKVTDANMTDSDADGGVLGLGQPNICADRPDNPVPPNLRNRDYKSESDTPAPTLDQYPGWPA
ncbi:hypothetical protein ACFXHA_29185 [Nocardia sp. NPDC059240]|uniref:hypothetical protein n=1 Tax=Nocardia sp. NPDC059240 TaxID=3346786 RepID=UPI00369AEB7D